jgi:hypothetical protein
MAILPEANLFATHPPLGNKHATWHKPNSRLLAVFIGSQLPSFIVLLF